MNKIELSIYKQSIKYFSLFDVLIKGEAYNRDEFLKTLDITPNSYRRSKNYEQKIGTEIVLTLSKYFGYSVSTDKLINYIEDLTNSIYNDMYYKVFRNYDFYISEVDRLIEQKYNVYPILNLLKLFLQINSLKKGAKVISENQAFYEEIKKYKNFFNDDLLKIFELLYLTFEKDVTEYALAEEFSDGFSYFIVSYRSWLNKKYVDCLYFAEKAQLILLRENNFKRILYLNFNIMSSLNYVKNYKACLDMCQKQMLTLNSFECEGFERENTLKHMIVAALGLKDYQLVVNLLSNNENYSLTELTCYLFAMSKLSIKDYQNYFSDNIHLEDYNENNRNFLIILNKFILNNDKKLLIQLEQYNFVKAILEILKNA